jgi:peptidoglycan/LPS O-acetylase OafA/YrhL
LISVLTAAVLFVIQGIASETLPTYHMEDYGFILFGVFLALFLSQQDCYRVFMRVAKPALPIALAMALITLFDLRASINLRGMSTLYALSVTVLLGALVSSRSVAGKLLSTPGLVLMGRISYGIYLVHILCLDTVERIAKPGTGILAGLFAYAATFLLAAGVAYIAHFSLERPMIRLGRRLSDSFSLALAGIAR